MGFIILAQSNRGTTFTELQPKNNLREDEKKRKYQNPHYSVWALSPKTTIINHQINNPYSFVQVLKSVLLSPGQHLKPYGKLAPGAESHYEICCSFPQNALESSIFIRILWRRLGLSDLDLQETIGKLGSL